MIKVLRRMLPIAFSMAVALQAAIPAVTSADTRCSGNPGVQVWENSGKGGRSAVMCGVGYNRGDFTSWGDNLNWWENWNDRISSYETFNFTGHKVTFWAESGFKGQYLYTINNEYLSNLSDWTSTTRPRRRRSTTDEIRDSR